MAELPTEVIDTSDSSVVTGKRKAEDPLPAEPAKRSAASSSTNPKDSEDDSEQEDDDLGAPPLGQGF
ncbi:hypothetical protein EMPS_01831 [Entomortierella parvispora]|uniref:Uncharacterized protein n=1 Tax=Entomortierella parvispora TaxID=205924 RepID=A0A9P3H3T2_9FUNG|nr:hypothetical protein EMPS_01831 [Entomortierella parvispora]